MKDDDASRAQQQVLYKKNVQTIALMEPAI